MGARLAYLDTLKVLLVLGVIAMHSAITYGLDGSWYLESYDEMSGAVVDLVTAVLGVGWLVASRSRCSRSLCPPS
jgi:peptidoglycan/LPS O-acetylase OafA/YrhL